MSFQHLVRVGCLIVILTNELSCQTREEIRIEKYEQLIDKNIAGLKSYQARRDNSDFLKNVDLMKITDYGEFDFIVVGGGSAGGVVASRLAEVEQLDVLLLEAGKAETEFSLIPGVSRFLENSDKSWGYTSTPQTNGCFGFLLNRCPYVRGLSLGGSGAINGLMYVRGARQDYDKWAGLGNPGWSYDEVLPYFKKSEDCHIPDVDKGYHGFNGPIGNAYSVPRMQFDDIFQRVGAEMGLNYIDINGRENIGASRVQNNINHGRRASAGVSYVQPTQKSHPNFNVTLGAYVIKILIRDGAAYGVLFVKDGRQYRATSRKEVIISGGSVNTPQLLMLSGIGPRAALTKLGIKLVVDLPVGQYMKDHPAYTFLFFRTNNTLEQKPKQEIIREFLKGKGLLSVPWGLKNLALVNVNDPTSQVPDVEIIFEEPTGEYPGAAPPAGFKPELLEVLSKVSPYTDVSVAFFMLHPKSTGKITLKSKNPVDFPEIDIGIFNNQDDIATMLKGIRYALKMAETPAFRKLNATVFMPYKPCLPEDNSDRFWICVIRHTTANGYHMVATAKMGPRSDPLAVVDAKLRVYGVDNLRVVDDSVVPVTIGGHLSGVAFMVGEKGAAIIKEDHGLVFN